MRRYLQYAIGFSPFIALVALLILSSIYPPLQYVEYALIIAGIIWLVLMYRRTVKTLNNLQTGHNLPKPLEEHPIYVTNEDEYRLVRLRVEAFVEAVENSQASTLELTADNINCLRNRGITPIKSGNKGLSMPEYYEIRDGKIYQYWLAFFPFSRNVFLSIVRGISFIEKDGQLLESQCTISENGKNRRSEQSNVYTLAKSKLLDCILRQDKTLAWSEAMTRVISQLEEIEIQSDRLLLITQPNPQKN